jgi:hypothetical protein
MTSVTDAIVNTLSEEGVTLLPFDEEMSIPDFPHGSIEWEDFFNHHRIGEKTGYSSKMYADVDDRGVSITSVVNSKFAAFDPAEPEAFASEVKQAMINFYVKL